jgi:copper(I)-binding protein
MHRVPTFMRPLVLALAIVLLAPGFAVAQPFTAGPVSVTAAWAQPSMPGAPAGAAYFTVINTGRAPLRLLGGSSPVAARVELHMMSMDGGVMRMRMLPQGIVIPAGGRVDFRPGGLHVMLVGLRQQLVPGTRFPMTLWFDGNIAVNMVVPVGNPG